MALLNTPKVNISAAGVSARTRNTTFEILLMIILIGVGYPYLLKPKMDQLKTAKTTLSDLEKKRDEYNDIKATLNKLTSELENPDNESRIKILDESLPLTSRITRTYLEIQKLVQYSGMVLGNLQVDQTVDQADVNIDLSKVFNETRKLVPIKVNLSVIGSMDNFQNGLIKQLERQNRVYNIDSLDIQPEAGGLYAFRLQLKVYVYVPDGTKASVPTTAPNPGAGMLPGGAPLPGANNP